MKSQIAKPMSARDWFGTALIILPIGLAIPRWGPAIGFCISVGVHQLVGVGRTEE